MGAVRAKPATGFTKDGKPRKRAPALTVADIPHVREIIDSLPMATFASLSRAMGREETAIRAFCLKHNLLAASTRNFPVRAKGVTADIFKEIDRRNLSLRKVADQMQVDEATVGAWRSGRYNCNAFTLECLAQIAGYRLVLAPLSEVSSQDGRQ